MPITLLLRPDGAVFHKSVNIISTKDSTETDKFGLHCVRVISSRCFHWHDERGLNEDAHNLP